MTGVVRAVQAASMHTEIGLNSLLCMGGEIAQGKGMLPSRSLGLRMVIKAFATGNLNDETLPEIHHLAC